jgi:hypothetical protein
MFKEALGQSASDGRSFVEFLTGQGVLPGIKVDEGLVPLEGCPGETSTRGLDTLAEACRGYAAAGARFAKWRAALKVGDGCPSERCIEVNAQQLADYAAICQVRPVPRMPGRGQRRRGAQRAVQGASRAAACVRLTLCTRHPAFLGSWPRPLGWCRLWSRSC